MPASPNKLGAKFGRFEKMFSSDIGIDLGTANTLVYVAGLGIIINEPTVVAVNQKTNQVVAMGHTALSMVGRTPGHIQAIRPLVNGVISDFEVTEEMLSNLLSRANKGRKKLFGPRVLVGVPSGITNVEVRAVRDAVKNSGAREVHIVEEPMAGAVGVRLPIHDPVGSMIVDIGGGTTDIAIISLGGIVRAKNLKIAGDRLNSDIISYVRSEFKILIGEKTAESVKMAIGTAIPPAGGMEALIRGRDLITGLPREVAVTDSDIREAISPSLDMILESIRETLERTPPEILADVMHRGLFLVGGGALLKGVDQFISQSINIPVHVDSDPLTAVARGTGIMLEELHLYDEILLKDDEISPDIQ